MRKNGTALNPNGFYEKVGSILDEGGSHPAEELTCSIFAVLFSPEQQFPIFSSDHSPAGGLPAVVIVPSKLTRCFSCTGTFQQ
jgi:hypothetical protein